jgi:hypothetical protein
MTQPDLNFSRTEYASRLAKTRAVMSASSIAVTLNALRLTLMARRAEP